MKEDLLTEDLGCLKVALLSGKGQCQDWLIQGKFNEFVVSQQYALHRRESERGFFLEKCLPKRVNYSKCD